MHQNRSINDCCFILKSEFNDCVGVRISFYLSLCGEKERISERRGYNTDTLHFSFVTG